MHDQFPWRGCVLAPPCAPRGRAPSVGEGGWLGVGLLFLVNYPEIAAAGPKLSEFAKKKKKKKSGTCHSKGALHLHFPKLSLPAQAQPTQRLVGARGSAPLSQAGNFQGPSAPPPRAQGRAGRAAEPQRGACGVEPGAAGER